MQPTASDADPRVRTAEIVAVGTELLLGEIVDTNGAWLAATFADRGVEVRRAVRVPDRRDAIVRELADALDRSDLVLVSGGLGPTEDDLTREAIADLVHETPRVDPDLEAALRARYARTGRAMPERNLKQAWLVPSARPLANPNGTAPGWLVRIVRPHGVRLVAALPGPPHELKPMVEGRLLRELPLPDDRLWIRLFKTSGLGESEVADRLDGLTTVENPNVATYAKADGVHVRVSARAGSADAAEALGAPLGREVARRLGDAVWGEGSDTLAGVVVRAAIARGARLAVVEGATGGALAAALSEADPDRRALGGAVIAWRTDAMDALGDRFGADRGASALEAATDARATFAVDAAIAVGELRSSDDEADVAIVDVAVHDAEGSDRITVRLPERSGSRVRLRVLTRALDLLRRRLAVAEPDSDSALAGA